MFPLLGIFFFLEFEFVLFIVELGKFTLSFLYKGFGGNECSYVSLIACTCSSRFFLPVCNIIGFC